MKRLFRRRFLPALLCLALALSLSACGGKDGTTTEDVDAGTLGALSGSKAGSSNVSVPEADHRPTVERGAESLAWLQDGFTFSNRITGAVAYLGQREQGDSSSMTDWLSENHSALISEMPFLLDIPAERVLGAGYGDLYCIVPRDENTSLAVNHITWESYGNGIHSEADEVLYREECAQPVLVFVDADEPDIEIILVTNEGVSLDWIPQIDEYGYPIVPIWDDGEAMLMDFAVFGYTNGFDYSDHWDFENQDPDDSGWEPAGDDWWLPPTELGLADTSWLCDSWVLELRGGDASPEYAGTADLYYAPAGYIKQDYLGVWRMEDDCLYLKLSADSGDEVDASFPILISPSGEDLYFQRSRTGAGIPFLPDGTDSIGLLLYTG